MCAVSLAMTASALVGSNTGARWAGAGGHAGWMCAEDVLAGWPEPQGISIFCLHDVTGSKSVSVLF